MAATLTSDSTGATAPPRRLTGVLVIILAVAALVVVGTVGWLVGGSGGSTAAAGESSVDAGFARDMSTHHTQAVTMANYERDNTADSGLKVLAYDIETSQQFQIGEMQGWLDAWGLGRESSQPQMSWMPGGHMQMSPVSLMPGMATPAEISRLESLHGKALDILFLQLMIRHHQGGLPMAQYAISHARTAYVRSLAQSMYDSQTAEIVEMEQLLRRLGATTLSAPTS
ncbi:MAG: DUF305 domain-containing protein [Actinomycetota bacterium]|nr:DUF305 domain-containing protein [Actinomycetota bacterium]